MNLFYKTLKKLREKRKQYQNLYGFHINLYTSHVLAEITTS